MVQASDSPTIERVSFSSAGAVPFSFHPPVRGRSDQGLPSATDRAPPAASLLPPNEIDPRLHADPEDLETRAEILRCHLLAMKDYVSDTLEIRSA
jgi:hypothetical protein